MMNNVATEVELLLLNDRVDMFDFCEHCSWLLVYPKETIIHIRDKTANINLKAPQLTLTMNRRPDVIMLQFSDGPPEYHDLLCSS